MVAPLRSAAARIKFPKAGRSWFPAWWMLLVGYNYNRYGQIDVMEFFWQHDPAKSVTDQAP